MKLAIVAGEASGDLHASEVVHELRQLDPSLELFGIGGDLLASEGMRLLHHAKEMGIVGLFNVLRHLRMFRRVFDDLVGQLAEERPDAVLLVDYPDFNLRVAKKCRAMGLRVIYYISPQLWAWRKGRVRHIAKYVDQMIVIFPFETDFYRSHDVPVTYVGHPLVDELAAVVRQRKAAPSPNVPLRLALLPGSRRGEVASLLPRMLDAVKAIGERRAVDAFVIQAPTIAASELLAHMQAAHTFVRIVPHDGGDALAAADIALSSSGTATLECALLDTPVVVMYQLSPATYFLAKRLVTLPYFSLVNIVASERIVPELIQADVNGERIAKEVETLLARYDDVLRGLALVRERLGDGGASRRAAAEVFRMLTIPR
jgi:lipid-A-disaccharide synthase